MLFGRHANLDNLKRIRAGVSEKGDTEMTKHRARICVGYNDDGTQVIKRVSGTTELELMDNAVRAILSSERRSEFIAEEPTSVQKRHIPTFREYAEEWLRTYKQKKIKVTTLGVYNTRLNYRLYPFFGDMQIDQITTKDIQSLLDSLKDSARNTTANTLILLRSILESAVKDGLISRNPAKDQRLSILSTREKRRNALTVEEVRDIIDSLQYLKNPNDRRYQALLIFTGMRRGEVLGLRWEDIDLKTNEIHVSRNATFPPNSNDAYVCSPKTSSGYRDIPILPILLDYLKPLGTSGYIIGNGETPDTKGLVEARNRRIARTIDMHGATPHVFRHTFATMLYDSGTDTKTIQSIMGQSDYKTTLDRYCHPRETKKQLAAASVNAMLN